MNFWSAECPYSERTDRSLVALMLQWGRDVELLSIAANRSESIQLLEDVSTTRGISTVLIDAEHIVADLFEAITTPQAFIMDRMGILRYRGAVDDVTFRQRQATRCFVEEAVAALLAGRLPDVQEMPAYGCAIVREI